MAVYDIVAGTTSPVVFQLLEAGSPIDLTNCTVTLLLEDVTGTTVDTSSAIVTIIDPTSGLVEFDPNGITYNASISPYGARWKIVDISSKISYVPSTSRDIWSISGI